MLLLHMVDEANYTLAIQKLLTLTALVAAAVPKAKESMKFKSVIAATEAMDVPAATATKLEFEPVMTQLR